METSWYSNSHFILWNTWRRNKSEGSESAAELGGEFVQWESKVRKFTRIFTQIKTFFRKFGLLDLPIYSKCVDSSQLIAESASRVYHDAKEYMKYIVLKLNYLNNLLISAMDQRLRQNYIDLFHQFWKKFWNLSLILKRFVEKCWFLFKLMKKHNFYYKKKKNEQNFILFESRA